MTPRYRSKWTDAAMNLKSFNGVLRSFWQQGCFYLTRSFCDEWRKSFALTIRPHTSLNQPFLIKYPYNYALESTL